MKKIKLKPPTPEMIEAVKPFFYEMFPWMKEIDEMKEQLRQIKEILEGCNEDERYSLQGGIFNWPLLVQDLLAVYTKR